MIAEIGVKLNPFAYPSRAKGTSRDKQVFKQEVRMARWIKGQSGNPRGRIPGTKLHISRELEKIVMANGGKVSHQIAKKLTELTLAGDTTAARLLLDRLEGRVS